MYRYRISVKIEKNVVTVAFPDFPHLFSIGADRGSVVEAAKAVLLASLAKNSDDAPRGPEYLVHYGETFVEVTDDEITQARRLLLAQSPGQTLAGVPCA